MPMNRNIVWMFAAALTFAPGASAQMVVHAISGKITAINPATKTVDVAAADGSVNEFKLPSSHVQLDFDNNLRSDSIEPDKFQHVGNFAVVYYYGYDANRTAVAIKDLGTGAFQKVFGTVVGYNKKDRQLTVKDAAGKTYTFTLSDHLIIDNGLGVEDGRKYEGHKGAQVRVTYVPSGNKNSAVFVSSSALSY